MYKNILNNFNFTNETEVTLELNPHNITRKKLETFKSDLIKYILAVVLIVVGINKVIDIVILVSGLLLVVVGIIKLITDSIDTRKTFKHKNNLLSYWK